MNGSVKRLLNWIGGEFAPPSTSNWFPHFAPASGQAAAEVPDSDVMDLVKAIQASNKAWASWQKTEAVARAGHLLNIAERFESAKDELAAIQSRDQGTPIFHARNVSVPQAIEIFRFYAQLLLTTRASSVTNPQALFFSNRLPIGVVAAITPWTEPIVAMASRLAPAIAAGGVLILKPSEFAPESAEAFARTVASSTLPSGVLNVVHGRGESLGQAIVSHPGLSTLSFMGRTETGRHVLRESAEFLKRTHLALGARNPVLVFADIDLEKTVPLVADVCLYPGASCLRGSRLFVQETIYDRFLELFKAQLEKTAIGDPSDEKTRLGPLVSDEHRKRFFQAVDQAVSERGKLLTGGSSPADGLAANLSEGFFARPTAVYDLTLCSTLQQDEVEGPLITIASFKYQHDAIKNANNSPLGQAAYLFHRDASKSSRIAMKIEAGRVFVNSGAPLWDPRADFGGIKLSGLGREGGEELVRFFSRETSISQNLAL